MRRASGSDAPALCTVVVGREQDCSSQWGESRVLPAGAAEVSPRAALPGPVLVRLLNDLGLEEGAARSTILRMRHAGWITSVRTGRTVGYAPSPSPLAGHRRHTEQPTAAGRAWDGTFHGMLVTVPERRRSFRDALRRAAALAGYRSLRPGLLIAPSDRTAEIAPWTGHPRTRRSCSHSCASRPMTARSWLHNCGNSMSWGNRYRALTRAAYNATRRPAQPAGRAGGPCARWPPRLCPSTRPSETIPAFPLNYSPLTGPNPNSAPPCTRHWSVSPPTSATTSSSSELTHAPNAVPGRPIALAGRPDNVRARSGRPSVPGSSRKAAGPGPTRCWCSRAVRRSGGRRCRRRRR
jgi:hypothetical protein